MKILLVEDQSSHMAEAEAVLRATGVEYVTASDEYGAMEILREHRLYGDIIEGVITDIFIPHANFSPYHREADQPCGLAVALEAERLGLPFVLCTAGYHHGAKYDWICGMGRLRGWPEIIDGHPEEDEYYAEVEHKDWQKALDVLQERLNK